MVWVVRSLWIFLVSLACACSPTTTADGDSDADADGDSDADTDDGGSDADTDGGEGECDDNLDCDDGHECTEDICGVGNLCRHIPFDDRCPEDQECRESRGCVEAGACEESVDCDDGVFCNGAERCISGDCFDGDERTCDDGDECTIDYCTVATDSCVHDPAPGCITDGGPDGGPDPFDPELHYDGVFRLLPAPSSECFSATYHITLVTFSSTADELAVQAGSFHMTETPRPSDESFDVSFVQGGCGTYQLTGTFVNSDQFDGRWTAVFSGGCNMCGNQDMAVTGVRN